MRLISQNAIPGAKREDPHGGAAPADEGNESKPESTTAPKRRKNKRSRERDETSRQDQEREMKKLETALFGTLYSFPEFGTEADGGAKEGAGRDAPLFFVDKSTGDEMVVYEDDLNLRLEEEGAEEEKKPVWVDEEEEKAEIDIVKVRRLRKLRHQAGEKLISGKDYVARLRAQHTKLNPGTEWAHAGRKSSGVAQSDDDESDDESGVTMARGYEDVESNNVLRSNEDLVVKSRVKLLPGLLEYSKLVDANREEPSNGQINSVQFHRNGQLLLAAGLDKRLRLFQVDGKRNTNVQSIFLEDCPIKKASFLPDGSQVICSGRRKFFYTVDLVKASIDKIGPLVGREEKGLQVFEVSPDSKTIAFVGNEGYILLVSTKTKELVGTLKMNGTARSLAFVDGGQQLMSSGGDGQIYHWDLRMRRCIHRAIDEGCIAGSALCASPDNSLFAAGSTSGIVNVYKRDEFLGGKRKPLKTIENLKTMVSFMKFNHDVQILAICSNMKRNSMKLVHVPTFSVFSNWPAPKANLGHPQCLDFSPGGGFMAFGNSVGKVLLYKLHHYQKA